MYIRFVVLAVLGMLSASCAANRMEINPPIKDTSSIAPSFGKTWECPSCTPEEKYVLSEIQEKTNIKDRVALATILGNIKQESNFRANVCEGGARVPYDRCYRGGYGIIQWTTASRYNGLGQFADKYGCDPSTLPCQTRYMINERRFQQHLPAFEVGGQTVTYYMRPAYRWLGWGIKGNRQVFSYNYSQKLVLV